ncbi:GNAT family N-acetyltransferase [Mycolicibacterium sp. XJ870]
MAEVRNIPEARHYEITVDGEHAGLVAYVDSDNQRILYHTEVDDKFEGQGLAATLVSEAMADTQAAGKRIVPVCPYIAKYVQRHHDFDDALDPVTPAALAAVESAQG